MQLLHTKEINLIMGIEKIDDLPFYTEGPAMDSEGNVYCTTLSGRAILRIDTENKITEWAYSDCPNGQIVLPDDDHLVCDVRLAAVRRFDSNGKFIKNEIEKYCAGVEVYCPNDLITDSSGNIYFTDSVRDKGKVCFLGANGEQNILVNDLDYPNGLVLSSDKKTLYVAESYKNRVIKIALESAGKTKDPIEVFADLPTHSSGKEINNLPDGLAMDRDGNLWVAHYGMQAIHKLSPEGKLLTSIDTNMPFTSNLLFCDPGTIVVTGGYGEPGPGGLFKVFL
jgi:gluconolactonase